MLIPAYKLNTVDVTNPAFTVSEEDIQKKMDAIRKEGDLALFNVPKKEFFYHALAVQIAFRRLREEGLEI